MKNIRFVLAILFAGFLAVSLTTCGGSGGGGGGAESTTATLTTANAPHATGAAIQAANLVGSSGTIAAIQPPSTSSILSSLEDYSKSPLRRIIDKGISISEFKKIKTSLDVTAVHIEGSMPQFTESCLGGGSVIVGNATWTGPDHPTNLSQIVDFQANMTFNSCNQATETMNGTLAVKFTGPLSSYSKITITATNFSFSNSATSDDITMDLTMTCTNLNFGSNVLTAGTIEMTGTLSGTASGNPINVEFDGFTMIFSSNSSGTTVSISGKIKPVCLASWITLSTNAPLFIPTNGACPTAGNLLVLTGAGTVNIVLASDSKITVYFNGTECQSYADCQNVNGFCAEPPASNSSFSNSQRIMAKISTNGANVRNSLGNILFTQYPGVHGTIISDPSTNPGFTGNGRKIMWDSVPPNYIGVSEWTAESVILAAPSSGDFPQPNFDVDHFKGNSFYTKTSTNRFFPVDAPDSVGGTIGSYGNCTWYAYGRMLELGYNSTQMAAIAPPGQGTAYQWALNAAGSTAVALGITMGSNPVQYSIAVRDKDSSFTSGHVAVVESWNNDGTITVSESSYFPNSHVQSGISRWNFLWRHRTCDPSSFSHFIHVSK